MQSAWMSSVGNGNKLPVAGTTFFLCLLTMQFAALGRVIRVPQDAATIQAGLDSLLDTDTLLVERSIYEERVVLPPFQITIAGVYDPNGGEEARPTIDMRGVAVPDSTAILTAPPLSRPTIESFRLIGGAKNGIRSWSTNIFVRNCVIDTCNEGFRQVQDSLGARAEFEDCHFRMNRSKCAIVRGGNELRAIRTLFEGGESSAVMVSLSGSMLDSCTFTSRYPRTLLYSARKSVVTNCIFGPCDASLTEAVLLGDSLVEFTGNRVADIVYGTHAVKLMLDNPDSTIITENTFVNCRGNAEGITGAGALAIAFDPLIAEQGPVISYNTFRDNSSNTYSDDIAAGVDLRLRIHRNRFEIGSLNGLPSIGGSTSPWQETPVVLRGNVFDLSGYALRGSALTDALFNYWGDPSGPYHEFDNPQAVGDTVSGPVQFIPWLSDTVTSVREPARQIVQNFSLSAYPNPFNPVTTIRISLPKSSNASLVVYNVAGQEVATLVNESLSAGSHEVSFDGMELTSGVYFCRLSTGEFVSTMKMVLLK